MIPCPDPSPKSIEQQHTVQNNSASHITCSAVLPRRYLVLATSPTLFLMQFKMQFHQILVGITAVVALLGASLLGHSYILSPTLKVANQDPQCSLRDFERNLAN
jgi:hypothetical protein